MLNSKLITTKRREGREKGGEGERGRGGEGERGRGEERGEEGERGRGGEGGRVDIPV